MAAYPSSRETGGLRDTITPYNLYTDEGNGFSFANYNAHEMLFTIERAVQYWNEDKPMWRRMMLRGMADRFDWTKPAQAYLALYQSMLPILTKPETVPPKPEAPVPESTPAPEAKPAPEPKPEPKPTEPASETQV